MWNKDSWKSFKINQQPIYDNLNELDSVLKKLEKLPAIVFSGETRMLKNDLENLEKNRKFILQIGDCSESFENCTGPKIHNYLRIFLQMASIIEFETSTKVIKIGRIAGQYAKPRSSDYEDVDGVKIPVYRGDIINDFEPTFEKRLNNPQKLLEAYFYSIATLNLIRAFISGGYGELENFSDWERHFYSNDFINSKYYNKIKDTLTKSLKIPYNTKYNNDILYTSHESLLLNYETAFARLDTLSNQYYSTSAHTIWLGERTRDFESAHVEFVSGLQNPIGIKIGPKFNLDDVIKTVKKINPKNEFGKIMIISRMGFYNVEFELDRLQKAFKNERLNVIWICDPMHGNTFNYENLKVRKFDDIVSEIKMFFKICSLNEIKPGGVHLEITGEYVSECVGGINGLDYSNLKDNYNTKVDPRLNASQALEIAIIINELIKKYEQ